MKITLPTTESVINKQLVLHQCVVEANIVLEIITAEGSTEIKVSKKTLRKALELM